MKRVMLTTIDNPFDPFDQFDDWMAFDLEKGYCTCAYLDRVAATSNEFTDKMNNELTSVAIDQILKYDPIGIYKKVEK